MDPERRKVITKILSATATVALGTDLLIVHKLKGELHGIDVDIARQEGFIDGHKVGRETGYHEGYQQALIDNGLVPPNEPNIPNESLGEKFA